MKLIDHDGGDEPRGGVPRSSEGIKVPAAFAAHLHLLDVAVGLELQPRMEVSAIRAVKLYDRESRYLFAWIVNTGHLLFYIRKPALQMHPELAPCAHELLSDVKINPAGEVTIRISDLAAAEALTACLFSRLV